MWMCGDITHRQYYHTSPIKANKLCFALSNFALLFAGRPPLRGFAVWCGVVRCGGVVLFAGSVRVGSGVVRAWLGCSGLVGRVVVKVLIRCGLAGLPRGCEAATKKA
jgi:hypothetical protein